MTLLRRSQRTAEKAKAVKREDNSTVKQDKKPQKKEERTRVQFDYDALRADVAYDQPDMYNTRMKPEDFNMNYYHLRGLNEVLLFDCAPEKLGMKMVNSSFKVQDVMKLVGENKMIRASEVATQAAVDMSLWEFIKNYESPKTEDSPLYNVVSLEFSDTKLADRVTSPDLIRNVDWASSWPDERKQREVKFKGDNFTTLPACPKVDSLCGMGPKGCYTDFHIDFHGSSFWFHVVRGLKVFWLIPLTNKNLELYHDYEMTYRNADNNQFFGAKVEKCVRIDVLPGNTLFVPAGYIHAVYTAEDSLIFSGNYLHNRAVTTQLKAIKEEKRSKLSKSVRYPFSDEVVMFYLAKIVNNVTGRVYIRPMSRNQHKKERGKNRLEYIGQLFKDENKHHIVPTPEYYRERGGAWIPWEETDEFEQSKVKLAQRDAKKDGEKDGEKKKGGAKNDPKLGNVVRPTSVKDVDQDEVVTRIAYFLKQTGKELTLSRKQAPSWTSAQQQRPSDDGSKNLDIRQSRSTTSALVAEKKVDKSAETPVEPAKPAASVVQSTTKITEVFDFAGDEIKIEKEVTLEEAKSHEEKVLKQEEAAKKPVVKRVGLGDALTMLAKKPKMSVLDKSNIDWKSFKQEQKIDEDLAIPNRGKDGDLNKQDFLLKADHAQFEKERAMRDTIRKQNQ